MFCFHRWLPSVNRVQTCSKCGEERVIGCGHKFEMLKEITVIEFGQPVGMEFVLQCSHCGDIVVKTSGKTKSTAREIIEKYGL